jgi:hypothetical protein
LAALALPHLPGMTQANSMTVAVQQLQSDCALARQLAMLHRSPVYMIFLPPYSSWSQYPPVNDQGSYNNLLSHQYSAYALVSLRTVGDQPGQANPQYLTEWKTLPDGVFIAPWMFAARGGAVTVYSTNTLSNTRNTFIIRPFLQNLSFPFPATDATNAAGYITLMPMPYIGFSPLGQLTTNSDEYIPLDRGRVLNPTNAATANSFTLTNPATAMIMEAPPGNASNNCNIIHLDWLTARAKIERNQQQ